jgi:hypothetical protein
MPPIGIPIIVLLSLGAAVLAMIGFAAVRKFSKPIDLVEHQTFLDAMCNIVGTLVSILLGLLVASALDTYQSLERTVDVEADAVAQIFRFSRGLPDPLQGEMQTLCEQYCDEIIRVEWPSLAKGVPSRKTFITFTQITDDVVRFKPADNGQTNVQASLLQAIQQIGDCRRTRVLALSNRRNEILMPLLAICAITVMLFTYLYVKHVSTLQAVLIACVAVVLGGNISLVYLLSKPFEGDWRLQPRGFELTLRTLREVYSKHLYEPPPGTRLNPQTLLLERDPNVKKEPSI